MDIATVMATVMPMDTNNLHQDDPPAMISRTYTIAGTCFKVFCPEMWMYRDDGALHAFRTQDTTADHTLVFSLVEELAPPEGICVYRQPDKHVYIYGDTQIRYTGSVDQSLSGAYMRASRCGNSSSIQVRRNSLRGHITSKVVLTAMEMEHHIAQKGGFLLHASYIGWNNRAILFTAPSGVGKSTQAALWENLRGARLLNGDRAAVAVENGQVFVHGIPFSGSSGVAENVTLPLAAIVYLSQAPMTRITRLSGVKAFRSVWEGCSINLWNKEDVVLCTESVLHTAETIPVYHLACTPDESAVTALEQELTKQR